jgi:hypothetical protein
MYKLQAAEFGTLNTHEGSYLLEHNATWSVEIQPASWRFLACLILRSLRLRQHVPRLIFNRLNCFSSLETMFLTAAEGTPNPA